MNGSVLECSLVLLGQVATLLDDCELLKIF